MENVSPQLDMFGRDDATDLALACLNLGWGIIQRRNHLTAVGAATLKMGLAWLREEVYRVTRPLPLMSSDRLPPRAAPYDAQWNGNAGCNHNAA